MGIASVIDKPMASPVGNLPETSAGIPNAATKEMSNFLPDTVTPVSRSDDIFEGLPCHRCEVNFSLTHRNPREQVPLGDLADCSLHPTTTDMSQEPDSPSCRPDPDIPAHSVQRIVPREKIDVSSGYEPLEMIPERKQISSSSHKRSRLEDKPGIRNSHVNSGTYLESFIACPPSIRAKDGGPNLYENNSHPLLEKCSINPQTIASLWRSQERLDMNVPSNGNHGIGPEDTSNRIEVDQWVLSPLLMAISTEAPSSEICVQEDSFEHTIARRLLDESCGNSSPRGINLCDGVPSEEDDIGNVSPPLRRSPSQEPESVPESRRASRCLTPDSLKDYHAWRRRGWISSHALPFFSVSAVSTDDDMELANALVMLSSTAEDGEIEVRISVSLVDRMPGSVGSDAVFLCPVNPCQGVGSMIQLHGSQPRLIGLIKCGIRNHRPDDFYISLALRFVLRMRTADGPTKDHVVLKTSYTLINLPKYSVEQLIERGLPVPQPTILGPSAYIPPDETKRAGYDAFEPDLKVLPGIGERLHI
uniref:Uncharacterized protein n=1 Tax=Timema shepardi TaxID=629360 RepID=A0A7R9FX51_TIMSH|nr:unnamed protein product [Timema shepardi]